MLLGCGASTIVGVGQERSGNQTVDRAVPFDRLGGPRIDVPENAQGIAPLRRITAGPDAPGWSNFDALLLRAADELYTSRFISEATWNGLADRYTQDQLVEVVLIVGNYTQLTMFQNTLGVQLPPDIDGLPEDPATR